ncbi:MAG: phosphatidylcholine/phosphatidylserine synthase [Pseudomonadota bacterium]|nr:phosphatidylcholine/phosphatidylserine synthase [Pseudomonadota bacterium]
MTDGRREAERPAAGGGGVAAAWLVHLFTATGVVIAYLALAAVMRGEFREALMWLILGLVIDGVDGSLARWARVKERAPRIDGDTLDLIIDYLTYVFVPAVLIVQAGLVPEALAPWLAGLILVSALYDFTRRDLKTADNYFRGFPALWNLVAFYLLVGRANPEVGAIVVVALGGLTFAPVHFVHPFRVTDYGRWLPALAAIWAAATAALLWPDWSEDVQRALLAVSLAAAAILFALGLLRTLRGSRQ